MVQKHKITGIKAFSKECFRKQLAIPGMVLFLAKINGKPIGANLVLMRERVAYDHLAAYSPAGYHMNAAYGVFWSTFKYLSDKGIQRCDIGAGAGLESKDRGGLDQFKRGWTRNRLMAYFCGKIFDPVIYEKICHEKGISEPDYFPAYRMGEFS